MSSELNSRNNLREDLCRLSRFGANISDAHSCFIFLPESVGEASERAGGFTSQNSNAAFQTEPHLIIGGFHTLSSDVLEGAQLPLGTGIIGWASKHNRSIHVSPFDRDSRTLGIYKKDQKLKSFIGIPVPLDFLPNHKECGVGVLACDSRKSFAFSKLQTKLLEDLGREVAHILRLTLLSQRSSQQGARWDEFLQSGIQLLEALGSSSVDALRVRFSNFNELELVLGTRVAQDTVSQIERLVYQALPPHIPALRLANGDIIIILDSMMSGFYENKFRAIARHVAHGGFSVELQFGKRSLRTKRGKAIDLAALIAETAQLPNSEPTQRGTVYEYRRA